MERFSAWFDTTRSAQRAKLASRDAAEVVAALRSYSERRLFKSTLASDLLPLLDRPEPAVKELACQMLGRLGSRAAVRGLLDVLSDASPSVREAARQALRTVVGEEIPVDVDSARQKLGDGN